MKVRCINAEGTSGRLIWDEEYEVMQELGNLYSLKGVGTYLKTRFEIVEEDEGMVKNCKTCAHYDECIWKSNSCWSPKEPVAEEKEYVKKCINCAYGDCNDVNGCVLLINPTGYCRIENYKYFAEKPKQLKKMTFAEAIRLWDAGPASNKDVKSVITGETLDEDWKDISLEAYAGLWTIEGVYENEA